LIPLAPTSDLLQKRQFIVTRFRLILWLSLIMALTLPTRRVSAQQMPTVDGRQFILSQSTSPGVAADWAAKLGRATPAYFQPVRLSLPTAGIVTFYEGPSNRSYDLPAAGQAGLLVGRMYRLRVSGLPEFPGTDFYPSIELIDRLHPPAGKAEDYPVEFELTLEELEWASNGRLVTKVVYLEQPDRIPLSNLGAKERISTIEPHQNVVAEADLLGRPVAIVRLGGRTPNPNQPEPAFFGPGGPIRVSQTLQQASANSRGSGTIADSGQPGIIQLGQRKMQRVAQR
jgi:hypothetical protein